MTPPLFVVDAGIPLASLAFGRLGVVRLVAGHKIAPTDLRDADALIVRSVTRVDRALLTGSPVRFVGTATIGQDHVALPDLAELGVAFASAPGCNAASVAEYVIAVLLALAATRGESLAGRTLGLIGVGHVGQAVARLAPALGLRLLLCDPPRARIEGAAGFVSRAELLAESDIVSLHVPLTREGPDATAGMANRAFFSALRPGAWLINSARGAVLDEEALAAARADGRPGAVVLDVWRGEPSIDPAAVALADLATPHVAGYSFDGKVNATGQILRAAARWLGVAVDDDLTEYLPAPETPLQSVVPGARGLEKVLHELITPLCPVARDDAALRAAVVVPMTQRAAAFTALRDGYPLRRQFSAYTLRTVESPLSLRAALDTLGFAVEPAE